MCVNIRKRLCLCVKYMCEARLVIGLSSGFCTPLTRCVRRALAWWGSHAWNNTAAIAA